MAICDKCEATCAESYTSPRIKGQGQRPPFEINRKAVAGFTAVGAGYAAMTTFCATVGMLPMSTSVYHGHLNEISKETEALKKEVLEVSRKVVRRRHEQPDGEGNDIINIAVSFDGSWHKRGFTSLYGVGVAIEVETGLVVDYEVLSKYCHMCQIWGINLGENTEEFRQWKNQHIEGNECGKNYDGPSGSMEVEAANRIWKRSIEECRFRYTTMLSDGDARTFTNLTQGNIYGDGYPIVKEECVNHIEKRLGTALRKLVAEQKQKGVTLGGRKEGSQKDASITALQKYYRRAIIENDPNVDAMKKAVHATVNHCSSTDATPRHNLCPTGPTSWCFYNKAISMGLKPASHQSMKLKLSEVVLSHIKPIYDRLTTHQLLERCARAKTQNANESLHSVIWRKCPKEVFVSKKKIDIAVTEAVGQFNMGQRKLETLRDSVSSIGSAEEGSRLRDAADKKRIAQSKLQKSPAFKKKRAEKKSRESLKVIKKNDDYVPGGH